MAQKLKGGQGRIHCVDLLNSAIEILNSNAKKYNVEDRIVSITADAEYYEIKEHFFNYILASSCLEHVSSVESFQKVIERMQRGTRNQGINCILMSTEVSEVDLESGIEREGRIELNMSTDSTFEILRREYTGWDILIEKYIPQEMEEHKNGKRISFRGNWLTFVARKKQFTN
jgi:tellurite methyltransferase